MFPRAMPNYRGRRPGTRRIVLWIDGRSREWIVEGTKKDGDAFAARKRLECEARAEHRADPRFSQVFEEYALHAEQHLKASTWKKVRIYQVATLSEFFGRSRLSALKMADVDAFKKQRRNTVGITTVNNELRVLRSVLTWAKDAGYRVPEARWKALKMRGEPRVRVWSAKQVDALYEATRAVYSPLLPMFVFLANTGCRKGEALACEWSWIDYDAGLIRIPSNDVWQPKNGKPREIPIADAVRAVLSGERRSERWVFPNRSLRRYIDFPKDLWWEIIEKAGLEGGPHTLRHTYASHFLMRESDLFLLGKILGHSTERVTELYAHLLPGHLERGRNAVNLAPTMAMTMAAPTRRRKKAQ